MNEATNGEDEYEEIHHEEASNIQRRENDRDERTEVRRGIRDRKQNKLFTYDELGQPKVNNVYGNIPHFPTYENHHQNQLPVRNVIQPYEQCFSSTSQPFQPVMYAYPSHPQQIVYYEYEPQYQAQYQAQYY